MIDHFMAVFDVINLQVFLLSVILFFIGYVLAPTVYYKQVKWLTAYPFFIIHLMDKHFNKDWSPGTIFLVIFCLNSFSLFTNLLSGWGIILPFLLIVYTGLNVGVVMYHTLNGQYYYLSLLNPVAALELPAAWISVTMGIQFGLNQLPFYQPFEIISFGQYVSYFSYTVLPLLALAGIIETVIIVVARRNEDRED